MQKQQPRLDPKRLVFIDETSVSTTITRLYGRAPQGERLVQKVPHGNWKTITFIAALRHNRVTAPFVLEGPMNGEMFKAYTEQFLAPTLRKGDIVFMDLAALTWNGYKSCYYRTYCAGKEPTNEQKDIYATALKWLYDSIKAVKVGTTTREIASKWPSAKEAWGYAEEDQAAANLWGHGLGLAQYDQPVISRIWSLDHPIEIKEGMVFALETQHGKKFEWGVRIEEMLIVHKDRIEIISAFPVEQITVVDPMPGYSTLAGR